jgi:hypothetical protein
LAVSLLGMALTGRVVADEQASRPEVIGVADPAIVKVTEVDATAPLLRDPRQLAAVVGGIISYSRWPQPSNPVRLCVLGHSGLVEQVQAFTPAPGQRGVVALAVKADANFARDCDAVYVTPIPPENARALLRQVTGLAVLTVGEGAEFCSDGGMFCLDNGVALPNSARPRFSANLDAISRSGLRVNPQVLLLARVPKAAAP